MAGNVADVSTCAKRQEDIFRGYDFTGVEFQIFLFPALPVMSANIATAKTIFFRLHFYRRNHGSLFNSFVVKSSK